MPETETAGVEINFSPPTQQSTKSFDFWSTLTGRTYFLSIPCVAVSGGRGQHGKVACAVARKIVRACWHEASKATQSGQSLA